MKSCMIAIYYVCINASGTHDKYGQNHAKTTLLWCIIISGFRSNTLSSGKQYEIIEMNQQVDVDTSELFYASNFTKGIKNRGNFINYK